MPGFKYKAFISYSHVDKAWAEKLAIDLKRSGYSNVFLDSVRLESGKEWNKALLRDLVQSEHLIVIWSSNAETSEWVSHERARFEAAKDDDPNRLIIHLQLDAQTKVFTAVQNIPLGVRPDKFNTLNPSQWNHAVQEITRSFQSLTGAKPVYRLILTSTLSRLRDIRLDYAPEFAPKFSDTLETIGVKAAGDNSDNWKQKLSAVYGNARSDWHPFGGAETIISILDQLKAAIDGQPGAPNFVWKDPGEGFWGSQEQLNEAIAELSGNLALVVVDPISLYDDQVRIRCDKVRYRLMVSQTIISILAPFPISPLAVHVRKLIKGSAEEIYDAFYSPPFAGGTALPHVNVCTLDQLDVQRLLRTALRSETATTVPQSPFTRTQLP
jgi:hypothetical protein